MVNRQKMVGQRGAPLTSCDLAGKRHHKPSASAYIETDIGWMLVPKTSCSLSSPCLMRCVSSCLSEFASCFLFGLPFLALFEMSLGVGGFPREPFWGKDMTNHQQRPLSQRHMDVSQNEGTSKNKWLPFDTLPKKTHTRPRPKQQPFQKLKRPNQKQPRLEEGSGHKAPDLHPQIQYPLAEAPKQGQKALQSLRSEAARQRSEARR